MALVSSLTTISEIVKKYFPNSEYATDRSHLIFTFTEKAYAAMAPEDRKMMSRNGWMYDSDNDCWTVYTEG